MGIRKFTDKNVALTFKVLITNMSLCKLELFNPFKMHHLRTSFLLVTLYYSCLNVFIISSFSIASYANVLFAPSVPFTTIIFLFNQFFLLFPWGPWWQAPEYSMGSYLYASVHNSLLFSFLVLVPVANHSRSHSANIHNRFMVCKESVANLTRGTQSKRE